MIAMSAPPTVAPRTLVATAVLVVAAWLALAGASIHAALPENALGRSGAATWIRVVLPQGWGFFTRDPREIDLTVHRAGPDGWEPAISWPIAIPDNLFGLSRAGRGQGIEFGGISAQLEWDDIPRCRGEIADCIDDAGRDIVEVENTSSHPTICGDLVVQRRTPVPWAWVRSHGPRTAPYQLQHVYVRCPTEAH